MPRPESKNHGSAPWHLCWWIPFGLSAEPGSKALIRSVCDTGNSAMGILPPRPPPPNSDSTLVPPLFSGGPFLFLPPGAPLRADFAKSFWDLDFHGQSCWGRMFSWTDMLPACSLGAASTTDWEERLPNCWSYLREPENRKGAHPGGSPIPTESLLHDCQLSALTSSLP